MRQALEMAREVQMSTLPAIDAANSRLRRLRDVDARPSSPAATRSTSPSIEQGLLIVLGDATGHGIAPALSVTQMQAMLRIAFRLGADLESAFMQVNNRLAETLPADRFITAFIGLLDPSTHRLRFHSGGQGPIFHYRAATRDVRAAQADELPAGRDAGVAFAALPSSLEMAPGDILVLLSDGFYEYG